MTGRFQSRRKRRSLPVAAHQLAAPRGLIARPGLLSPATHRLGQVARIDSRAAGAHTFLNCATDRAGGRLGGKHPFGYRSRSPGR